MEITESHQAIASQVRQRLLNLETALTEEIATGRMQAIDCNANLTHQFAPGVYMRTLKISRGTLIVGKIHKHEHPNILSQGEVLVLTEGGGLERLVGPVQIISPAGTKRAVYALEDTVWTTIHLTDETDLAKIEAHVIASSFADYENFLLESTTMTKQIQVTA